MHIPDGFINVPTSAGFGAMSAAWVWYSLRRVGEFLDDRRIPLAGLLAAFVFAAQMINFPVAAGTSGHLIGGVLAAVLAGPWMASLVLAVVLVVQGIFFADGGLSAIGLNVFNLGLVAVVGGYGVFLLARRVLPAGKPMVVIAAGIAAGVSVILAALSFTLQFAIGGEADVAVGTVAAAMVGVHSLIGAGEGLITAMVISAILSSRPDLVYGYTPAMEPTHG